MKNKNGNVAVIAIIIVIVAITAGIVGWMFAKKSQVPVQQADVTKSVPVAQTQPAEQSAPTDETTSWQTYQNEKDGFEVKIPQDMKINDVDGIVGIGYSGYQKNLPEGGRNMFISSKKISLENFIKEYEQKDPGINKITKQEDIQVGQIVAKKLTGTTAIGINTNFALIKKNDGSYIIIEFSDLDDIHKKILTTFKMVDSTSQNVVDLKTVKGWLEGTRSPLILVLTETTTALSGYSGNKFSLIFSKDSVCTFAGAEASFSCTDSKMKWGVGDRVRVYGSIKGGQILVNKLEIVSSLPIEKW